MQREMAQPSQPWGKKVFVDRRRRQSNLWSSQAFGKPMGWNSKAASRKVLFNSIYVSYCNVKNSHCRLLFNVICLSELICCCISILINSEICIIEDFCIWLCILKKNQRKIKEGLLAPCGVLSKSFWPLIILLISKNQKSFCRAEESTCR